MSDSVERFLEAHEEELRAFGFSRDHLPEGFPALVSRFGIKTLQAIFRCRAVVRSGDAKFRIGMSGDAAQAERKAQEEGSSRFDVLHRSRDVEEVRIVEADTRLYFLYHFPGRCLNKGDYRQEALDADGENCVYAAFFDGAELSVLGRA